MKHKKLQIVLYKIDANLYNLFVNGELELENVAYGYIHERVIELMCGL